jgi:transcriptional regulator with XRE-family HTH domain
MRKVGPWMRKIREGSYIPGGRTMRDIAKAMGITSVELSDIELCNTPIPSDEKMVAWADSLGIMRVLVLDLARREREEK